MLLALFYPRVEEVEQVELLVPGLQVVLLQKVRQAWGQPRSSYSGARPPAVIWILSTSWAASGVL